MHHWDRNTTGILERSNAPQEQSGEVSIHSGQMEPPLEEQQSQQGVHRNPNAYRTMRDHIQPPRVSAPSYIVPPPEDIIIKPYIVPLLPTFRGMESENPYSHPGIQGSMQYLQRGHLQCGSDEVEVLSSNSKGQG